VTECIIMPRETLHHSLQGQPVERVNNVPENREKFLGSVFRMVDKIEEIKEYLKDQDYMDLYTIVTELEKFKNDLVDTAIYQAVLRKHNIQRRERKVLSDAEKRKAGYLTCPYCKCLLLNATQLKYHQETTKKCIQIRRTRSITARQVKLGASVNSIFKDGEVEKDNMIQLLARDPTVKQRLKNYTYHQFLIDITDRKRMMSCYYQLYYKPETPDERDDVLPKFKTMYEYYLSSNNE